MSVSAGASVEKDVKMRFSEIPPPVELKAVRSSLVVEGPPAIPGEADDNILVLVPIVVRYRHVPRQFDQFGFDQIKLRGQSLQQ